MDNNHAVIFDMDGVLLDTEPLWGESMMQVARSYKVPVSYEDLRYTTGLRIHEVTHYWHQRFPWEGDAGPDEIAESILDHIIDNARRNAGIMPGVLHQIEYLKTTGIPVGVATSSPLRMAKDLLSHFGLFDAFASIATGDACTLGKPHPEVYLRCAEALHTFPFKCVAVEDSVNGMVAAKAARMAVVVVPEAAKLDHPAFGLADMKFSSLKAMQDHHWHTLLQ